MFRRLFTKRKPLIIWGACGHAKVLREATAQGGYELVAVFDNDPDTPPPFVAIPIYHGIEGFKEWKARADTELPIAGVVAIGGGNSSGRLDVQAFLEKEGIEIVDTIHPTAFVAPDVEYGTGCQVLANAAIAVEVQMGKSCIVNTSASVDHESRLGNCVHIAPGAHLAGCVEVGDFVLIGAGATVLPRVRIGSHVVIGAGSTVTRDIPDNAVAWGNPARVMRRLSRSQSPVRNPDSQPIIPE